MSQFNLPMTTISNDHPNIPQAPRSMVNWSQITRNAALNGTKNHSASFRTELVHTTEEAFSPDQIKSVVYIYIHYKQHISP